MSLNLLVLWISSIFLSRTNSLPWKPVSETTTAYSEINVKRVTSAREEQVSDNMVSDEKEGNLITGTIDFPGISTTDNGRPSVTWLDVTEELVISSSSSSSSSYESLRSQMTSTNYDDITGHGKPKDREQISGHISDVSTQYSAEFSEPGSGVDPTFSTAQSVFTAGYRAVSAPDSSSPESVTAGKLSVVVVVIHQGIF